jgi:hypothetical protein
LKRLAVPVLAGERGRVAGFDLQLPELKLLGGNALFVTLRERDFVEKPGRPFARLAPQPGQNTSNHGGRVPARLA